MKKEKIKRYKKTELLELLIRLRTENDQLRAELADCKKRLEDKTIAIDNAGSIADAAMQLSGIFEAAQAACAQYVENIEAHSGEQARICARMEAEAAEKCRKMEADTLEKCRSIRDDAQQPISEMPQPESKPAEDTVQEEDFDQVLAQCAELVRQDT